MQAQQFFPASVYLFFSVCVCVCAQRTWRIPQCQLYLFVVDFDVDDGRCIKCVDPRDITSTKGSVTYDDKLLANDTHVCVGWCGTDRERVLAVLGKRRERERDRERERERETERQRECV